VIAGEKIPFDLKMTLEKALKQSPELKQAYETEEATRELIDTALVSRICRGMRAFMPPGGDWRSSRWSICCP